MFKPCYFLTPMNTTASFNAFCLPLGSLYFTIQFQSNDRLVFQVNFAVNCFYFFSKDQPKILRFCSPNFAFLECTEIKNQVRH